MNTLNLQVGTKIKIGKEYAEEYGQFNEGEIITLIDGVFECDNGLYCYNDSCPAIWNGDDYDSIFHLFGNDLEYFMDCEVVA